MTCRRCDCWKNKYNINCISYSGNSHPDFYFLGEMAGANEAKESQKTPSHFIGKAGQILDNLLDLIDLKREEIAIANSARCWKDKNKTPTKKELDACFPFTFKEVKKLNPKVVIAMGGSALYQALGKSGIKKYRGKFLWSDKLGCKVYAIYHPMSVGYDPDKKQELIEDFKRIPSLLTAELDDFPKVYKFKVVEDDIQFNNMYESIIGNPITFDFETTGLDHYTDDFRVKTLQICKSEQEIYVIRAKVLENNRDKLEDIFNKCPLTGQDFSYDAKVLHVVYNIFPQIWEFDTCLAEYLLSGMKNNDLDYLTGKYNPDYVDYWVDVANVGGAHKMEDEKKLFTYGACDVGTLIPIARKQYKALAKESMLNLFENITMPCNRILTQMSNRGVTYDLDHLWKIDKEYEKKTQNAFNKVKNNEGVKACEKHFLRKFNPRSHQMVHWLLLNYYELPVINTNKDDKPTIGIEEMKRYAKKHKNPYCKAMVNYRSYQNIRDNFLSGVVSKLQGNIAHTKYSIHATATGRPNSKNPNLLNIPREKDIKRCIIARPGHKFVEADEAQLEVRIASVVYDEPALIEICNDIHKDMHCSITAKAFNRDYDEIYDGYKAGVTEIKELRVQGKAIQFGVIYQEGANKLAYNLGIEKEEAQKFIDEYYTNFPFLKQNIDITKEILIAQGYLDNYFKFRRRWSKHTEEDHASLREGVNFLVQSLAWNLLQLCLIQIDHELTKRKLLAELVMQVYDSVIVESPDEEVDEVAHIVKNVMETVSLPYENINRVKLMTDVEVGSNLADTEKIL